MIYHYFENNQFTFTCWEFFYEIFFLIFIWNNSQKWKGSNKGQKQEHNHEIEIEIEKQRYLSKIHDWVYGRKHVPIICAGD